MAQVVVGGRAEALQAIAEQRADLLLDQLPYLLGVGSLTIPWVGAPVAVVVLPAEDGRRRRPPAGPALSS